MNKPLLIDTETHLLHPVNFRPSPHHDERPDMLIDMVVVHGISLPPGQFGGSQVTDFFCGHLNVDEHAFFSTISHLRVSAHLFIRRTGEIIQFVPFHKRAWHAGESFFDGRTRCNDFSIGIELEGTDTVPYEPAQYEQLITVVNLLIKTYPGITANRVVGHVDIAPGRKTDPGPVFDWSYLKGKLA